MPSSCKDIRDALALCLQSSDCIMIHLHTPSECLRPPLSSTLPTKCQQLQKGYAECKRGMVDMRKRFRGNQPISVGEKDIEEMRRQKGDGGKGKREEDNGGQLYAGKSAFGSTARKTDGREPEPEDWREAENRKYNESLKK